MWPEFLWTFAGCLSGPASTSKILMLVHRGVNGMGPVYSQRGHPLYTQAVPSLKLQPVAGLARARTKVGDATLPSAVATSGTTCLWFLRQIQDEKF